MVARAWGLAAVLLAASLLALSPGVGAGSETGCGATIAQDDAGSGRDAGDEAAGAVPLPHEDLYAAALSYPDQAPVDAEDWFQATWEADGPRDVMVNVTGRALGLSYLFGIDAPAPVVELEAYGPGDDTPAYEAIGGLDGVSLEFTTERSGTWLFHVSLADAGDEPGCLASSESAADAPAGTYNLYWGCEPHCVVTTT